MLTVKIHICTYMYDTNCIRMLAHSVTICKDMYASGILLATIAPKMVNSYDAVCYSVHICSKFGCVMLTSQGQGTNHSQGFRKSGQAPACDQGGDLA